MKEYVVVIKSLKEKEYYVEAENNEDALAEALGLFLEEDNGIDTVEASVLEN